jgi:hypothetical protein
MKLLREYPVKTVRISYTIDADLPKELLQSEYVKENMDVKITIQKFQ